MSNLLDLLVAGLATGAIYALVALGFTLMWQTSQTINFAQGEFVMLPAFLMLAAMNAGAPFWLAIIIGIILSMLLLGLAFKMLLVDPMLRHGVLPLAIATMALSTGIKEAVRQFYSAEASPFPSIVPTSDVSVLGHVVSLQSVGVFIVAILAVIGLTALLNRTSLGHQMQAAAQNPTVARIIGIPVERMILLTFLINAALVALASLLITPIYLAKFSSGEVLGLAAFVAAIVGGFNQVRGAIAGGLLIGVLDNLSAAYVSTQYRAAVPLHLSDRRHPVPPARPSGPRGGAHGMSRSGRYLRLVAGLVVIAVLIGIPVHFSRYGLFILSQWAVMTIAAMGLNLTLGYAGQVSLAQGAFVGIGAYASAILTTHGWPLPAGIAVAIVASFVVGWLLGYPALRVQHHYLAFVTLAFSTLAFLVFRNESWLTGGIYGISNIPRPHIFGLATTKPLPFYYLCLGSLAIVSLALWWLIRSPWGRAFVALRENPLRAQSLGIDTRRYTLMAFAIGSALGGVAGALYAPLTQYIDPVPFNLSLSLDLLMMVIVGGSGFFFGPFLGAMIAVLLPEWLRFTQGYYLMLYALAVILLLIWSPTGILGILDRNLADRRARRASALRAASASSLEPVQ